MNDLPDSLTTALAGRYEFQGALGAGGMARVYLAADLRHGRKVAIKVVRDDLAASLGQDRFLNEIRTTASLQHPHILPLLDSGEAGGHLFYVMPFVAGESLRARMDRVGAREIAEAIPLVRQVAAALDHAHRHGVIHRDIKPESILLADGLPVVADFGIALAVAQAGDERLTQTGTSLGTPSDMSPEQVKGNVPQKVEQAIRRALAKDPANRFPTVADFAAALGSSTTGEDSAIANSASIVVLPFENLSADDENAFFADGLTEEIITDLSKVEALRVISRASAMTLKGASDQCHPSALSSMRDTHWQAVSVARETIFASRPSLPIRPPTARSGPRSTAARWTMSSSSRNDFRVRSCPP